MAEFKLSKAVFIVVYFSWVFFILTSSYWNTMLGLARLFMVDEYSYLPAILLVLVFIAAEKLSSMELCLRIGLQNIMVTLLLISLSLYFYMLSWLLKYTLELQILSLTLMFWAFIALIVDLKSLAKIKSLIFLSFLIVPIPKIVLNYVAALLSRKVAEVAASITSAKLIVEEEVMLKTIGPEGELIVFKVGPAYSGIVGLTGFIVGLPLIINFIRLSNVSKYRKITVTLISSALLLAILLLANLARLVLIVLSGKVLGLNAAINVSSYTSSIFLITVSVTAVILVISKTIPRCRVRIAKTFKLTSKLSKGTLALVLLLLTVFAFIIPELLEASTPYTSVKVMEQTLPAEKFLTNIESYMFNSTLFKILNVERKGEIEALLNVPIVKLVTVKYRDVLLKACIEISDNPAWLHEIPAYLTYKKYDLNKYWFRTVGKYGAYFQVVFIEASRGSSKILASYIKLPFMVSYDGFEKQLYVRVTVFTSTSPKDQGVKYVILENAINDIIESLNVKPRETVIGRIVNISYIIPTFVLIVAIANIGLIVYSKIVERE